MESLSLDFKSDSERESMRAMSWELRIFEGIFENFFDFSEKKVT